MNNIVKVNPINFIFSISDQIDENENLIQTRLFGQPTDEDMQAFNVKYALGLALENCGDIVSCMDKLMFAQEIVIDRPIIRMIYSFPFAKKIMFEEVAPNGREFTRADICQIISNRYQKICPISNEYKDGFDYLVVHDIHYDRKNDVWEMSWST